MTNILRWNSQINFLNSQNFNKEKHLVIKYEDLVENTKQTLSKIVSFLNLEKNNKNFRR